MARNHSNVSPTKEAFQHPHALGYGLELVEQANGGLDVGVRAGPPNDRYADDSEGRP